MKKFLALIITALLCMSFSVTALALEYTVDGDGNAVYDNAIGYIFDIDDVNGTIEGEDATIITSNDAMANVGSVWATWFLAEKVDEGGAAYVVKTDGAGMGGSAPAVDIADNQIIVVVHSSSSRPSEADKYPNWEDKVACRAVKAGDWIIFDGINIEAGLCEDGRMMVVTEEDVLAGLIEWPDGTTGTPEGPVDESEPEATESEPAEGDDESAEPDDGKTDGETAESKEAPAEESDPDIKTSTITIDGDGGLGIWLWVIIGAAVVLVIVIFASFSKKNK